MNDLAVSCAAIVGTGLLYTLMLAGMRRDRARSRAMAEAERGEFEERERARRVSE